jgi:regulator of sigma E protease
VLHDGKERHLTLQVGENPHDGGGDEGFAWTLEMPIYDVEPGYPAAQAGLRKGDIILAVNHVRVFSVQNLIQQIQRSKGTPMEIQFERDHVMKTVTITPKAAGGTQKVWRIGAVFGNAERLGFFPAIGESVRVNAKNATLIFDSIRSIIEQRVSPSALSGPIRIAQESGRAAKEGPFEFLYLMAAVSLNLAIFNLLPIPILDGGSLLLLIVEMLLQREVSMRVKENIFKVGFVFLMMVVVFVIYNDISHIVTKS